MTDAAIHRKRCSKLVCGPGLEQLHSLSGFCAKASIFTNRTASELV
jgi:hypothetical protein